MKITERDWILLSRFLSNQTNQEDIEWLTKWQEMSYENRAIYQDIQLIKSQRGSIPDFDGKKAFQKLNKKITENL